jgi:hypothetical protein
MVIGVAQQVVGGYGQSLPAPAVGGNSPAPSEAG